MKPLHPNNALAGLLGVGPVNADHARKLAAWQKARPAGLAGLFLGEAGDEARVDDHGNLMLWSKYGDYNSEHGWEIDHQHPTALGGSDQHANLRALNCKANRGLGGILGAILRGDR